MSISRLIRMSGNIFDCLHDGVAIVDTAGRIIYVNDANFRITGIPKEQLVGRSVREAVPLSHVPQVLETREELIGVNSEVNGRQLLSNIVPVIVDSRFEGVISIFRDLTEVVELTDRLEEAQGTIRTLVGKLEAMETLDSEMAIGPDKRMSEAVRVAGKAAGVASTVLITGESGTGKEVLARYIHKLSPRRDKPFMAINCAAIPESLLENELFGHEEGAFTGARKGGAPGLIELSEGGTILLDEIGDMPLLLQAKLLRLLQERQFMRVGGRRLRTADVRFLAATNRPLESMVADGAFREDLYYRLCVIRIHLPPLRERMEGFPHYVDFLMKKISQRIDKGVPRISKEAWRLLLAYPYPGNLRELENLLEVAMVMDEDGILSPEDLAGLKPVGTSGIGGRDGLILSYSSIPTLEALEKEFLQAAAEQVPNRKELSRILGIARSTLYRKLADYGILNRDSES